MPNSLSLPWTTPAINFQPILFHQGLSGKLKGLLQPEGKTDVNKIRDPRHRLSPSAKLNGIGRGFHGQNGHHIQTLWAMETPGAKFQLNWSIAGYLVMSWEVRPS